VSGRADPRLVAQALDRMGKHEASKVQRMASLYGLRSSMQGAGKRRIVMVRTGLPRPNSPLLAVCLAGMKCASRQISTKQSMLTRPCYQRGVSGEHSIALCLARTLGSSHPSWLAAGVNIVSSDHTLTKP